MDSLTYRWEMESLQVRPGKNEHTLKARRASGVRIRLFEGETPVPFHDDFHKVSLKEVEGDGEAEGSGGEAGVHRVILSHPGRYRIAMKPLPDFEPVPDQEVEVKSGEFPEVLIRLVRKP